AGVSLQLVRHLYDPDGVLDGWQHRLLGWHLDAEVVSFLALTGASVDVDEYGRNLPWYRDLPETVDSAQSAVRRVRVRFTQQAARLRRVSATQR
ncbi:MAG: hypothetical protein ACRYF3_10820, partial [Janthinobacterium lividum]